MAMPVSKGARGFEKIPKFILGAAVARYVFATKFVEAKVVVDIGCGCAYGTNLLATNSLMAIGADILNEPLAYAREHYPSNKLNFVRLDAEQLPFRADSIDVVVSHDTLEHLGRWEDFLNECQRVLKDDGSLICATPNAEISSRGSIPINPAHVKEFDIDELRHILAERFESVTLYGVGAQSRLDRSIYRLGIMAIPWLSYRAPGLEGLFLHLASYVTKRVWQRYQWLRVEDVNKTTEAELERYLARHPPYLLSNSFPPPQHLIGVATGRKRTLHEPSETVPIVVRSDIEILHV